MRGWLGSSAGWRPYSSRASVVVGPMDPMAVRPSPARVAAPIAQLFGHADQVHDLLRGGEEHRAELSAGQEPRGFAQGPGIFGEVPGVDANAGDLGSARAKSGPAIPGWSGRIPARRCGVLAGRRLPPAVLSRCWGSGATIAGVTPISRSAATGFRASGPRQSCAPRASGYAVSGYRVARRRASWRVPTPVSSTIISNAPANK